MSKEGDLLLFSGAQTEHESRYYHYCEQWLREYVHERLPTHHTVIFVPFAQWSNEKTIHTPDMMHGYAQDHWRPFGIDDLIPLHRQPDMKKTIESADMIIVGGGSIHTLMSALYHYDLVQPLTHRVREGAGYIGTSAGSIITGPTISTAQEGPILPLPSLDALNLVPFQIASHYTDGAQSSGPSARSRIINYLSFHPDPAPVVCMRDGSHLLKRGETLTALGIQPVTVFSRSKQERMFAPGSDISGLLDHQSEFYR